MSSSQNMTAPEHIDVEDITGAKRIRMPGGAELVEIELPVFSACSRWNEDAKKQETFDRAWLEEAANNGNAKIDQRGDPYMAPVHIRHHEKDQPVRKLGGFLGRYAVRDDEAGVPTLYSKLRVFPEVFAEMKGLRLPYRSVEIIDPNAKRISSLALLDSEVPFFKYGIAGMSRFSEGSTTWCFAERDGRTGPDLIVVQPMPAMRFADAKKPKREDDDFDGDDEVFDDADLVDHPDEMEFDPFADPMDADMEPGGDELGGDDLDFDPLADDMFGGDPMMTEEMDPMNQYATKEDLARVEDAIRGISDQLASRGQPNGGVPTPSSPPPVIANERSMIARMKKLNDSMKKQLDARDARLKEQGEQIASLLKFKEQQEQQAVKFAEDAKSSAAAEAVENAIDAAVKEGMKNLLGQGHSMTDKQARLHYEHGLLRVGMQFSETDPKKIEAEAKKLSEEYWNEVRETLAPATTDDDRAALGTRTSFAEAGGVKLTGKDFVDTHKDDPEKHGRAKRATLVFAEMKKANAVPANMTEKEFVAMAIDDPALLE